MRIRLGRLDPDIDHVPEGWTGVGFILSGGPPRTALAYDPERRPHALVAGEDPRPLDPAEVNHLLVAAVDEAGLALWPGGHTHTLPETVGIARRTLARDRIEKAGLPPPILRFLGIAAQGPHAAEFGALLLALGRYTTEAASAHDETDRLDEAETVARNAVDLLRTVRRGKLPRKMMDP